MTDSVQLTDTSLPELTPAMTTDLNHIVSKKATHPEDALIWFQREPFTDLSAINVIQHLCVQHGAVLLSPDPDEMLAVAEMTKCRTFVLPVANRPSSNVVTTACQIMSGLLPESIQSISKVVIVCPHSPPKSWKGICI